MGNTGQVIAALAGGALLGMAIILVIQLHDARSRAAPPEPDEQRERERRIEQAARIGADVTYELLQKRPFTSVGHGAEPEGPSGPGPQLAPDAVVIRSKRHLTMLVFTGVLGALVWVSGFARDAWQAHRGQMVGAAVGAAAAASAVTMLTVTPWSADNDGEPPSSAPTVTSSPTPILPPSGAVPYPSGTSSPEPSASPSSAQPSPSSSNSQILLISPSPEASATPTPTGTEPSAIEPSPADSGGTASAPGEATGSPTPPASSPPSASVPGEAGEAPGMEAQSVCVFVDLRPLLSVGACLGAG